MRLLLEVEGDQGPDLDIPEDGRSLIAFMSFAVSRGFGAQHPLIALADRLHDTHHVRLGPLTTFYDATIEDREDREKLELAWQPAAELRAALESVADALESDPRAQALAHRAGADSLGAEARALLPALALAEQRAQRVRLSYVL